MPTVRTRVDGDPGGVESEPTVVPARPSARWWRGGWWARVRPFLPAGVAVVVLRIRFLFTPITSDEGGYLAIGRAWGRGAELYEDVWIGRPQGLLAVFRALDAIGLGSPTGVRVLAMVACLVGAIACGSIAATLFGDRARAATALFVAVITSVPQYEGFIANAELLSSAAGAVALALILVGTWNRGEPELGLVFVGGIVAGCAMTIKQSGFDAFAAGLVAIVFAAPGVRRSVRPAAIALGGFLVPIGLAALHGALTGWQRWLHAVAGYRVGEQSALTGADWGRFGRTASIVAPVLLPTLLVVGVLLVAVVVYQAALRRPSVVLVAWFVFGVLAFLLGGQFHRHYWVIVMFPVGTAAGALVSTIRPRAVRAALLVALLVVPLTMTWRVARLPRDEVPMVTSVDPRLVKDEQVAAWFGRHGDPGERLYVLCYSAGFYGNADVDPPYPYLWGDNLVQIEEAVDEMAEMLASSAPPTFIADYQRAAGCDPTGRVGELMNARYARVATVAGIPVYEWTGAPAPTNPPT